MDKTDAALAGIIDGLQHAAEAMGGPAYNVLLLTARANAVSELVEILFAAVMMAVTVYFLRTAIKKTKKTDCDDMDDVWFGVGLISAVAAILSTVWFVCVVSSAPMNYMIVQHPEIAVGKAVLARLDGKK